MRCRKLCRMGRKAVTKWIENRDSSRGAALAFYALFSISPILIIMTSVAGIFIAHDTVRNALLEQSRMWVGKDGAELVSSILKYNPTPESNIFAAGFGLIAMLLGSTTIFAELKDILDQIWESERRESRGTFSFVWTRVLALLVTLAMTFLIMVSILFTAIAKYALKFGGSFFNNNAYLLEIFNFASLFLMSMLLFAAIYKILPNSRIEWDDVWVGAGITALLFTIGKTLIGLYLVHSATASVFGAAGSLIVVLFWIYYSSQIFLFGAEFTKLYADHLGSRSGDNQESAGAPEKKAA